MHVVRSWDFILVAVRSRVGEVWAAVACGIFAEKVKQLDRREGSSRGVMPEKVGEIGIYLYQIVKLFEYQA